MNQHTENSDFHLLKRTQAGDTEAFSCLVRHYHDRLLRHIRRRVENTETAKDLTQETWIKAYRGIQGYRGESSFYSWVYRIAENVITDPFRRETHDTDPLHLIDPHRIRETHPSPCQALERAELRQALRAALGELTPIRRRVFVFYYHFELPIKAIAKRMKKSEGTIKVHLRNAREQLKAHLKHRDVKRAPSEDVKRR